MPDRPPRPDYTRRLRALFTPDRQLVRAEVPEVGGDRRTAVIRLYDPIDSWGEFFGVSSKEFAKALDGLPESVNEIRLLINSPGGEVFEGIAVLNMLRSHPARVVAVVEGVAASAASFIAVGADELVMARNSELFIHDAWGLVVGNAQDMREMAEDLDRLSDNIASVYADKAGGDLADWRAAMARETWYSAAEAVAAGLADRVDEGAESDPDARNRHDLSIFNIAGRSKVPGSQQPVSDSAGGSHQPTEGGSAVAFSDEQLADLRQRLDLADDADEGAILAAVDGLVEQVTAPPESSTLPPGTVTIDAAQLDALRADAAAGREARAEQMRQAREQTVAAAVNDGRIPPARREHWVAQLEADPGSAAVLASLAKGLVPVGDPIGSNGAVDLDSDDALMAELFGAQEVKN